MQHAVRYMIAAGIIRMASIGAAQDVRLTPDIEAVAIDINGSSIVIARGQDMDAALSGEFAKTSRPCPEFCIQPMVPAAGVTPVAELEVVTFLQDNVAVGTSLLVDARLPEWFTQGAIPGAVNIPFAAITRKTPIRPKS